MGPGVFCWDGINISQEATRSLTVGDVSFVSLSQEGPARIGMGDDYGSEGDVGARTEAVPVCSWQPAVGTSAGSWPLSASSEGRQGGTMVKTRGSGLGLPLSSFVSLGNVEPWFLHL